MTSSLETGDIQVLKVEFFIEIKSFVQKITDKRVDAALPRVDDVVQSVNKNKLVGPT